MKFDSSGIKQHLKDIEKLKASIPSLMSDALNKVTDRHLSRVVANTPAGDSPDSPNLRNRWDRSGVVETLDGVTAEVFNTAEYASYFENGHRQTPGRLVFIELTPGAKKYGQVAKEHKGKWGIFIRLKKPFVKGKFVLLNSEKQSQEELNIFADLIFKKIKEGLE